MDRTSLTAAVFIARWVLGVLFLMAAYWKVFILTAAEHASRFFVQGFADTWIPVWLLTIFGTIIPYVELAAGLLLLIGWRVREVLIALGMLLIVTTYGHALIEPLFDIDGHTFTRLALVLFLLLLPRDADRLTLDHWLATRPRGDRP